MKIDFKGNEEDISMILISAERYAMGRRTYIVKWTCDLISDNLHLLTQKDKKVIIKDIKTSIYYGNECDKYCWLNLLKKLEEKENESI